MIVSAVADFPDGPYDQELAPVTGPFTHNAMISRHPNGSYLLFHIGAGNASESSVSPCSSEPDPLFPFPTGHLEPEPATTHIAESLRGPWRPAVGVPSLNNPAPFFFPNGTTLLFEAGNCTLPCNPNTDRDGITVVVGSTADGPWSKHRPAVPVNGSMIPEDPHVYRDKRGFHMLFNANSFHTNCGVGVPCGGHAWSLDGLTWSAPVWPAFGTITNYVDNSTVVWDYVERPQVVQKDDGTPLALFNARSYPQYDNIHTEAMLFCQKDDTDCVTTIQHHPGTEPNWSCNTFNCTCQGMSDYYGVDAMIGFGCAPPAAQLWWTTKSCNTCSMRGYCKGSECGATGTLPCQPPLAPGPCITPPDCHEWPQTCPGVVPHAPYKQTWMMNLSTIIMPCNDTGYTDPASTAGWGIVDFDWSNGKGTGSADGWAKHQPMDDEEMLFKQIQMTTNATKGTTAWVYRNTVYGYPWYSSVRKTLEDPAYFDWYLKFKPVGPWSSPKCDSANASLCSDLYHSQEQSPGFPHGDGDCAAPGCDCGSVPCGFYVWNHSSTSAVNGQTFQDWFVNDYMLNDVGRSPLVSGFFWDDVWNPACNIHDQVPNTCADMGFNCSKGDLQCTDPRLAQLTADYQRNMAALRNATLNAGKFAWQMLWTGGAEDAIGWTSLSTLVTQDNCAAALRGMCSEHSPAQTRAMAYGMSGQPETRSPTLIEDLASFLLVRGPFAWLGWGFTGCSRSYYFPPEFNVDYGEPAVGAAGLCKETAAGSAIFYRQYSKATVQMDCNQHKGTITELN